MVTYITLKCMAQLSITLFIYVLYEIDKIISFFEVNHQFLLKTIVYNWLNLWKIKIRASGNELYWTLSSWTMSYCSNSHPLYAYPSFSSWHTFQLLSSTYIYNSIFSSESYEIINYLIFSALFHFSMSIVFLWFENPLLYW